MVKKLMRYPTFQAALQTICCQSVMSTCYNYSQPFLRGLAIVILSASAAVTSNIAIAEYQLIDRVIAIVEDDIVLASEIRTQLTQIKSQISERGGAMPPDNVLFEQVLERAILENLQLQRAARIGMRVTDQELNETLNSVASRNGMTLAQFKASVEQQGESYLDIREQIRKDLLIREVQRRSVIRNINVSESEINNFLQSEQGKLILSPQYSVDHIMLSVAPDATEPAKQRAKQKVLALRELALANNGFDAIQAEITAQFAERSPLGWRRTEDMPSIFAGVINDMNTGDISEPISSDSGYHLIRINDKRGGVAGNITETKVRHILIAPNEIRTKDEAKILAADVKEKLNAGGEFVQLARKYSDDPGSALSGGDLGWTEPGALVPEFENTMDATEIGAVSEAFESQFGWHILEVKDRREKDLSSDKAAQQARMAIAETKYDDELSNWLQELRDDAYVDIK